MLSAAAVIVVVHCCDRVWYQELIYSQRVFALCDARFITFSATACLLHIFVTVTGVLMLQVSSHFGHALDGKLSDGRTSSAGIGFNGDLINRARTGERMWHLNELLRS
jgi:hypothetical protein